MYIVIKNEWNEPYMICWMCGQHKRIRVMRAHAFVCRFLHRRN